MTTLDTNEAISVPVKLYNVKEGSKIRMKMMDGETLLVTFHRIDGSYSFCSTRRGPIHLSASTPLLLCDDGIYEIES